MFYEHAEMLKEFPEDTPFWVGLDRPDKMMVSAWGDKRLYVDGEQMYNIITALIMTIGQWEQHEIARSN